MTDTPDFDKMSPEEIMKWMESLAKRQGATEGMTTSADMDVGSVSEDDERLKGQGDYIPFGMKKEDWEKQKAKEEEQKRQRLAAQQSAPVQAPPPPVQAPPPPPVQAAPPPPPAQPAPAAAASDTPDFDKMSPDEIMKWMESLAVRQGVTEGLTTSADAQIADISADDDRLKGKGDYIPFGMKQADWEKQLAKEEEQKRQRAAQPPAAARPAASIQPPASTFQPPAASVEPVDEIQPPDFLLGDLSLDIDEEETAVASGANASPIDWLSSMADDSDEAFSGALTDTADNDPFANDDPFAALEQLSSGTSNDLDMSWLTDLGSADDAFASLADLAAEPSAEAGNPLDFLADLAEPDIPATPAASAAGPQSGENSLEWLESMARDHGASDEELITPANLNVTRPKDTRPDGPGYTPYSFESASSVEEPAAAESELPDFLTEAEDASEDWLDEVARNVATDGHPAKPTGRAPETPAPVARTPEPAQEDVVGDVMSRLNNAEGVAPEDISRMFESLFQQAEQYADRDLPFDETPQPVSSNAEADNIPGEALKAEIPDWLRDQMISSAPVEASSDSEKMDALMSMFDDEPVEAEDFTAQAAEPATEMPDWLRGTPDDDVPAVSIGVDLSASTGDSDLPDWLQATEGETNDETIFATPNSGMPWEIEDEDLGSIDDLPELVEDDEEEPERAFELDTSDRWVEALTLEAEASDQLEQWYAEKTGEFSSEEMPDLDTIAPISQPAAVSRSVSLQRADLPVEAVLMMGEPQAAPEWLLGSAAIPAAAAVAPSVTVTVDDDDVPEWLRQQTESVSESADLDDIPEWLRNQVDDTVASDASDLPPWLASEDIVTATEDDDLPDWLKETMAEEAASPVQSAAPVDYIAPTVVMTAPILPPVQTPTPTPVSIQPVKSSPAPMVPVNIDVASTLQSARGKVSSGDVDGSLGDYELIVRANTALDEVVKDLSRLADHKDHKKNPAVYRVLGDTLMRRGDLKAALDTYRKALHML